MMINQAIIRSIVGTVITTGAGAVEADSQKVSSVPVALTLFKS